MVTLTLEKNLQNSWREVKRRFNDPPLDKPRLDSFGQGTAHIDMQTNEIVVFKKFVEVLEKAKIPREVSTRALLYHEVGHYMICPFDLKTNLRLITAAEKIAPGKGSKIVNYYTDLVVNFECINNLKKTYLEKIHSVNLSKGKPHKLELLLNNLYHKRTRKAVKKWKNNLSNDLHNRLINLNKLGYKSRHWFGKKSLVKTQIKEVIKFTHIIKDLLDVPPPQNSVYSLGDILPKNAEGEVAKAYGELAKELSPEEADVLVDALKNNYDISKEEGQSFSQISVKEKSTNDSKSCSKSQNSALESELSKGDLISKIVDHYSGIVQDLVVKKEKSPGGLVKVGYEKWSVDKSASNIDFFNSMGKIIPGITQSKKFGQEEGSKEEQSYPDCIIALDTSGSMGDPYSNLSYSVLGAFSTAKTYLTHRKKVGVINFSNDTVITSLSNKEQVVYNALALHQAGGTILDIDKTKSLLKEPKGFFDFVLITDGYISNINDVLNFVDFLPGRNRVTIFDINNRPNYGLKNYAENKGDKTSYHLINAKEDFNSMAIGEAMSSFGD